MGEQLQLLLDYIYIGDIWDKLKLIPSKSVRCCVTSPPYFGLRDYGTAIWIGGKFDCKHLRSTDIFSDATSSSTLRSLGNSQLQNHLSKKSYKCICGKCGAIRIDNQIGLEKTPEAYIKKMVLIFREIKRILTDDGTLWINIGDSYWGGKGASGDARADIQQERIKKGSSISKPSQSIGERGKVSPLQGRHNIIKPKDVVGIPWMLAFALREDGWFLRQDIIWRKSTCMPESVTDRFTKSHEYVFLFTKQKKYFFDSIAIRTSLATSTLNDSRLYDKNYSTNRPDRNYPGQSSHGAGLLKRKSGNLERKPAHLRGVPEDTGKNQAGSVPWEGETANRRNVLEIDEQLTTWKWLFDNAPADIVEPLWEKFIEDNLNKDDVWNITPAQFKESHFATFPEELPAICIKAGSSEHGQCDKCRAPYIRIAEKELKPTAKASHGTIPDERDITADQNDQGSNRVKSGHLPGFYNDYKTTSWQKTCTCEDSKVIPDIILDPFMGAGTTALVAKKLGRNFIGIDINAGYVKDIAVPRLQKELGMYYTPQSFDE